MQGLNLARVFDGFTIYSEKKQEYFNLEKMTENVAFLQQ
jgi:hypothetical protein